MLKGVSLSETMKIAHHWQSEEDNVVLMNGLIRQEYNQMASGTWGLLGEVGQPLKLRYNVGFSKSQFRQDRWVDETYIPLMIIPHAQLKFTDYFEVDISDLANRTFTCPYNVIIENSTFTATMQAGTTFTFDALVVKIAKTDMLIYTYRTTSYYYLPEFDITFGGISCAIEVGTNKLYESVSKVWVGQLGQDPNTGLYDFNIQYIQNFIALTRHDIADYTSNYVQGSVTCSEFGDNMKGLIMLSPFTYESHKTSSGVALQQYFLLQSMFSNVAESGTSNQGIVGFIGSVGSVFSYLSKYGNSDFEITSRKQFKDYFICATIDTTSSRIASPNTWFWA